MNDFKGRMIELKKTNIGVYYYVLKELYLNQKINTFKKLLKNNNFFNSIMIMFPQLKLLHEYEIIILKIKLGAN